MDEDLPEQQILLYKRAFNNVDRDNDGFITKKELLKLVRNFDPYFTADELTRRMNDVHGDGEDRVDFAEFLKIMANKLKDGIGKEQMRDVFRFFDGDSDGFLSPHELRRLLTSFGGKFSDEEVNMMLHEGDINEDGKLSFEEFYNLMTSKQ